MKKHIRWTLVGLVLSLVGFLLANEQEIPIVNRVLFKDVNELRSGFNEICQLPIGISDVSNRYRTLRTGDGTLERNDKGFRELSNLFLVDIKRETPELFAKTWSGEMTFNDFKTRAEKAGFSKMTFAGVAPGEGGGLQLRFGNNRINAYLADSSHEYASFFVHQIPQAIEKKRRARSFAWSSFLYFLGLFIQILHIDWRGKNK